MKISGKAFPNLNVRVIIQKDFRKVLFESITVNQMFHFYVVFICEIYVVDFVVHSGSNYHCI